MRFRTSAALLAAGVLLVGCSSDAEPDSLPPVPSAQSSPVVLPLPTEAAAETPQGAAAFARYYMEVLANALASGDSAQLRGLSDPGCGGCTNFIGAVEARMPGERIEDAQIVVEFAEAPPLQERETIVSLRYTRLAGVLLGASGDVVASIAPEAAIDAEMRLQRVGVRWLVLGFRGTQA